MKKSSLEKSQSELTINEIGDIFIKEGNNKIFI
jgi:hypothetical protein